MMNMIYGILPFILLILENSKYVRHQSVRETKTVSIFHVLKNQRVKWTMVVLYFPFLFSAACRELVWEAFCANCCSNSFFDGESVKITEDLLVTLLRFESGID